MLWFVFGWDYTHCRRTDVNCTGHSCPRKPEHRRFFLKKRNKYEEKEVSKKKVESELFLLFKKARSGGPNSAVEPLNAFGRIFETVLWDAPEIQVLRLGQGEKHGADFFKKKK